MAEKVPNPKFQMIRPGISLALGVWDLELSNF
jgi:hypothetical protein